VAPLVFVWLGNSFPVWGRLALTLSRSFSGLPIVLLSNRALGNIAESDEQYFIEDFYKKPDAWDARAQTFDPNFRDGFWLKTTERFFVLEQFIRKHAIRSLFHAELDNWVFDLTGLDTRLDCLGHGLFCPRDSLHRGIASVIYINDATALTELNEYAVNNSLFEKNDMTILGHLLATSNRFFSLSTENAFQNLDLIAWDRILPKDSEGIFDAAAIGQFLFGIDPRNGPALLFNGFENENRGYDLWRLNYRLNEKNRTFTLSSRDERQSLNLFNIHVHSKLFGQLTNHKRLSNILNKINLNKRSLMHIDLMQNRIMRGVRSRLLAR
jgi:hypothetical protein